MELNFAGFVHEWRGSGERLIKVIAFRRSATGQQSARAEFQRMRSKTIIESRKNMVAEIVAAAVRIEKDRGITIAQVEIPLPGQRVVEAHCSIQRVTLR